MVKKKKAMGREVGWREGLPADGSVRAMFYSHNGFGLGHLRRSATIAGRFVEEVAGATALMVVGTPAQAIFRMPEGVDVIKVPSVIKVAKGAWHPRSLRIGQEQMKRLRARMIQEAADVFEPDLLLVDYVPTGVWGELVATLEMLRARRSPPKIVLGLRDILDDPEVTLATWEKDGAFDALARLYDEVIVYGERETFDTARAYGLDERTKHVSYAGYLSSRRDTRDRDEFRHELGVTADDLVVITAGGGYDAYPMMRACIDALCLAQANGSERSRETIIITGPLMEPDLRASLEAAARGLAVRVIGYSDMVHDHLKAADLVITMAGYNTLMDAIALDQRVLVIPRSGPSAEQRMRAELFAARGWVEAIDPDTLEPGAIAAAMDRLLQAPRPRNTLPPVDGAGRAVMRLQELLGLAEAQPPVSLSAQA